MDVTRHAKWPRDRIARWAVTIVLLLSCTTGFLFLLSNRGRHATPRDNASSSVNTGSVGIGVVVPPETTSLSYDGATMTDGALRVHPGRVIELLGTTKVKTPFEIPANYFQKRPMVSVYGESAKSQAVRGNYFGGAQVTGVIRRPGVTTQSPDDSFTMCNCWVERDRVTLGFSGTIAAPKMPGKYELLIFCGISPNAAATPPFVADDSRPVTLELMKLVPLVVGD